MFRDAKVVKTTDGADSVVLMLTDCPCGCGALGLEVVAQFDGGMMISNITTKRNSATENRDAAAVRGYEEFDSTAADTLVAGFKEEVAVMQSDKATESVIH